ncbi:MAG: hypothetical protein WDO71_01540 [Bacteroidota bacterium]
MHHQYWHHHAGGKKGNITLTAGPTMGIYKGSADIGFGINLSGSYYVTERIAITPGLMYMKHDKTNALLAASFKATYLF